MTNTPPKDTKPTQKRLHRLLVSLCFAAACLLAALPAMICVEDAADTDYAKRLFDPARVHTIELRKAEEDWADLVENALKKKKYRADATIDGERFAEVSIATRGNRTAVSTACTSSTRRAAVFPSGFSSAPTWTGRPITAFPESTSAISTPIPPA